MQKCNNTTHSEMQECYSPNSRQPCEFEAYASYGALRRRRHDTLCKISHTAFFTSITCQRSHSRLWTNLFGIAQIVGLYSHNLVFLSVRPLRVSLDPSFAAMRPVDLDLGLKETHVLITGGAGMIGSAVVSAFVSAGARVTVLDVSDIKLMSLKASLERHLQLAPNSSSPAIITSPSISYHAVDISDEPGLARAWQEAELAHGPVACCVALAGLDLSVLQHHEGGLADMELAQWERTIKVNVTGTFLTAREWIRGLKASGERPVAATAGQSQLDTGRQRVRSVRREAECRLRDGQERGAGRAPGFVEGGRAADAGPRSAGQCRGSRAGRYATV